MAEASPICRGKNLTIETILAFINAMPINSMKKSEFHEYTEKRLKGWTQTHSQIARQVALYYECDGICYPRFNRKVTYFEVLKYMTNWAKLYFVPNIYTPSLITSGHKATNIYAFLKNQVLEGENSFSRACTQMFGIELNNTDKVRVFLNNFTDLVISDDVISDNSNLASDKIPVIYPEVDGFDAKKYFDYFKEESVNTSCPVKISLTLSSQQIFYGAPGTGKSHAVNEVSNQYPDTIRTTFHPDSDYSSFVGAYKPTVAMEKLYDEAGVPVSVAGKELSKNQITYKFVKQAFLKAYVMAWKKFQKAEDNSHIDNQFLVIEEINRGNCAQIFGDFFQLLDRKNGFSEYPIEADEDIAKSLLEDETPENPSFGKEGLQLNGWQKDHIEKLFQKSKDKDVIVEKISKGKVLVLPCNLYIWATMNTSDQSLFPIDSAFKRRWDWKYVPINTEVKKWAIDVNGQKFSWTSFLNQMNEQIFNVTHSEDKKFGFFFCHADKKSDENVEEEDIISAEKFVSKVIFFIYNDVFKDYGFDRQIFEDEDGKPIQFHEYYHMDGSVDEDKVKRFLENLEVKLFGAEEVEVAQE